MVRGVGQSQNSSLSTIIIRKQPKNVTFTADEYINGLNWLWPMASGLRQLFFPSPLTPYDSQALGFTATAFFSNSAVGIQVHSSISTQYL